MKLASFFYSVHQPTAGTTLLAPQMLLVCLRLSDVYLEKPHCSCSYRISLKAGSTLHFIWIAELKVKNDSFSWILSNIISESGLLSE